MDAGTYLTAEKINKKIEAIEGILRKDNSIFRQLTYHCNNCSYDLANALSEKVLDDIYTSIFDECEKQLITAKKEFEKL